ncbi:MAG: Uma2 family endonuclease [Bacteroidota bacterium]
MISTPVRHRFSVNDLLLMEDSGIFTPDQRVELIDGEIIDMSPINQPYAACLLKLSRFFSQHFPLEKYIISQQNPIELSKQSLSQPDLVIADFRPELLEGERIIPSDIVLLVEISDSTYSYDRNKKYTQYAMAGIPVYWIVNLNQQQVEVYSQPDGDQYQKAEVHRESYEFLDSLTISPDDIFPKKVATRRV